MITPAQFERIEGDKESNTTTTTNKKRPLDP